MNGLLTWLQDLCRQNIESQELFLRLETLDNPGWLIELMDERFQLKGPPHLLFERSEHDWVAKGVASSSRCYFAGGPLNLAEVLSVLYNRCGGGSVNTAAVMEEPLLSWLQSFYYRCCDEDWEHTYGVKITAGCAGWKLHLDLTDTLFADKPFEPENWIRSESDFFSCRKEDHHYIDIYGDKEITSHFQATGGLGNLVDILTVFRRWALQVIPEADELERLFE